MDLLTRTQRDALEDTYSNNSPYYSSLASTYGENLPYSVAEKITRQHGTSVEALIAEEGLTLVQAPMAPPMVNILDLVMMLGY